MAKLQVPIEDTLMQDAKIFAIQQNITLKELTSLAIAHYIGKTTSITITSATTNTKTPTPEPPVPPTEPPKPTPKPKIEPKPGQIIGSTIDNPLAEIIYDPKIHFLIRKTHKTKPSGDGNLRRIGMLQWTVPADTIEHLDKDGNFIPMRFSNSFGDTWGLDTEDVDYIEGETGKKVLFEE